MARDSNLYWDDQRRKQSFEQAAEEAKRELFPELSFSDSEPSVTICRVCGAEGFHKEDCKLRKPDGKEKATIEDVMRYADTDKPAKKLLIEVERERLEKLNTKPVTSPVEKKKNEHPIPKPSDSKA